MYSAVSVCLSVCLSTGWGPHVVDYMGPPPPDLFKLVHFGNPYLLASGDYPLTGRPSCYFCINIASVCLSLCACARVISNQDQPNDVIFHIISTSM